MCDAGCDAGPLSSIIWANFHASGWFVQLAHSCYFFSYLATVSFFPVTLFILLLKWTVTFFRFFFFPLAHCYFLSCYFFSCLPTVSFFPVTFFILLPNWTVTCFPVSFFPTCPLLLSFLLLFFLLVHCYFLSCNFFSCYFFSYLKLLLSFLLPFFLLLSFRAPGQGRRIKSKQTETQIFLFFFQLYHCIFQ